MAFWAASRSGWSRRTGRDRLTDADDLAVARDHVRHRQVLRRMGLEGHPPGGGPAEPGRIPPSACSACCSRAVRWWPSAGRRDSSALTGLPYSFTMKTAPSTPSSALTVTGESTLTPTSPSVTDVVSFGTGRVPERRALVVITCGCGGAELPLHADSPSTRTGTSADGQPSTMRLRGPATNGPRHIAYSTSQ